MPVSPLSLKLGLSGTKNKEDVELARHNRCPLCLNRINSMVLIFGCGISRIQLLCTTADYIIQEKDSLLPRTNIGHSSMRSTNGFSIEPSNIETTIYASCSLFSN